MPLMVFLNVTLLGCVVTQQLWLERLERGRPTRAEDELPPELTVPKLSIPNSCFMSALNLRGSYVAYCTLHKYRYWAKLLLIEQVSQEDPKLRLAHSVCVFEYFGRFYVYDVNRGVYMLARTDIRRVDASAVAAMLKPTQGYTVGESLWVEET